MSETCPKCGAKFAGRTESVDDWTCGSFRVGGGSMHHSAHCRLAVAHADLAAANSEVERLRKQNAELQARYMTLANEASNASLHNAFE